MLEFPVFPHQNNIFSHDGWPGLDAFSCDATNVTGATNASCIFTTIEDSDLEGEHVDDIVDHRGKDYERSGT